MGQGGIIWHGKHIADIAIGQVIGKIAKNVDGSVNTNSIKKKMPGELHIDIIAGQGSQSRGSKNVMGEN